MIAPHGNGPNQDDHTGNEREGTPQESPIITKVVPAPPPQKKPEYHCSIHTPWWKTVAEFIGIGAVLLYTCSTYEAMKVENRPWVAISSWTGHIAAEMPFWAEITFQNVGKSPALDIFPREYKLQPSDIKFRPRRIDILEVNAWHPNTMNTLTGAWVPKFYFEEFISQEDWDEMMTSKKRFYIFEKATYTDVWGKRLETHFCNYYMSIANPNWLPPTPCDIYNDTPKE